MERSFLGTNWPVDKLYSPYKNVVDYELLPYHRYGEAKYGFLGKVYELADFESSPPETMNYLRSIIDEAFGRNASQV